MKKTFFKQAPHIGVLLKRHVKQKRIFQSAWARQQGVTANAITTYLAKPSMGINTLYAICQVLNYNFFKEIADSLPADYPPLKDEENNQLVKDLQQQVKEQQMKIETLEKALGLVGGR